MNPKLKALYKELPWLTILKKEIGDPGVVKVQRLDTESVQRWTGDRESADSYYHISGYFFDEGGRIISKITTSTKNSIWNHICHFWKIISTGIDVTCNTTVEDGLLSLQRKDEVRYVVLFGYDGNHYSQTQLYVYKMPQGRTASEFLKEFAEQRAQEIAIKFNQTSNEVRAELSK